MRNWVDTGFCWLVLVVFSPAETSEVWKQYSADYRNGRASVVPDYSSSVALGQAGHCCANRDGLCPNLFFCILWIKAYNLGLIRNCHEEILYPDFSG